MSTATLQIEKKKTLVPQLRFQEFDNEWLIKPLGDECNHISYGLTVRPEFVEDGIPLISAREVTSGRVNIDKAPKIRISDFNKLSDKAKPKKGDIFLTKTGTIGFSARFTENIPIAITQNIAVIRMNNINENSPVYLLQYFKTRNFYRSAISKVNQSTIMDLQLGDIRRLQIPFTTLPEQQKIASFLSAVDEKIQQLSRKKELLEQYKKGVMQQLFSGKLRFKDDNGNDYADWEKKKLGDVCEIVGGGTPDTNIPEYWGGEIQWFTPTEIKSDFVSNSLRTITELGLQKSSAKKLPIGTILLTTRATIGEASIAGEECSTNQGFQSLIARKGNSNIFIFNWIKQNKHELTSRANGSTFPEISKTEIKKIFLNAPSFPEQQKIANFLLNIDTKIESTNQQITQTQTFKKGLLQQMFV